MPGRRTSTILRGMDADIFIFIALELAAVLATVLLVVTVLTLQSPTTDGDVEGRTV